MRFQRRRRLDQRLARHEDRIGPPPPIGWIRSIREALGMSQFELGQRMGISQPRVAQIERAESKGTVELSTIRRSAEALGCSFSYAVVPEESLERMVRLQAWAKAGGDPDRADGLIDSPGLWRSDRPRAWRPRRAAEEEA